MRVRVASVTDLRRTRVGTLPHEIRRVLLRWPCNHVETPGPWISAVDLLLLQDNNFTPRPRIDMSRRRIVYQFELFPRFQQIAVTSSFEPLYQSGYCDEVILGTCVAALFLAWNQPHALVHSLSKSRGT